MRLALLISLLFFSQGALADPVTLIILVGQYVATQTAFVLVGYAMMIGAGLYGAAEQRKKADSEARRARQAFNDGLKDRTATRVATDAPLRTVYGRSRVGSDIVAMFTGGAKEEFKYLVCVHAAHECEAIEEIWVNNIALGTLTAPDVNGCQDIATLGHKYMKQVTVSVNSEEHFGGSFVLANTPVAGSVRCTYTSGDKRKTQKVLSVAGNAVTVAVSRPYYVNYDYIQYTSRVRVTKHLGAPTDPADLSLIALFSPDWTAQHLLRDLCYTVIRLDLYQEEFQGGIPPIEALIKGKKVLDVRSMTSAWSDNAALCTYDYLTSDMCGVAGDIPVDDYIAAANACDESIIINGVSAPRYTLNGTVTGDQQQGRVLEHMAQAMAGSIVATTWGIKAGKYTAPVLALSQDDIVGAMSVMSGTPDADLFNGVRGQYIDSINSYVSNDFEPYQDSLYRAADGKDSWNDVQFPLTNHKQRVWNLCRIILEDQRNGLTIKASFSLKVWGVQIGERIAFTSSFLGQTSKIYRVTDKRFSPDQAVELTMKEDAASIWDEAPAVTLDATLNTELPDPFTVAMCGNVQMVEELYETSGSVGVRSKARLYWDSPADVTVLNYEVEYKSEVSGVWNELTNVRSTYYDFIDLAAGVYDFRVKATNSLGMVGQYTEIKQFEIFGLTAAPQDVTGFTIVPFNGSAIAKWNRTTDLDVKIGGDVEIRFSPIVSGATWVDATILPDGQNNGDASNAIVSLATGTYFAKFKDSTGHYSNSAASFVATEALVTGWTTNATSTQHTAFSGAKTGCSVSSGILSLDSVSTIDDIPDFDSSGLMDYWGGILSAGEYLFDATVDLTTIASRRFYAHIKALSIDTGDFIDSRLLDIDGWADFDGGQINDTNALVKASVSSDNVTYTSWMPFMVADFNCRYAKFRLLLSSGDAIHNIQVSELSVTIKTKV